ncbi:MAG: hypothetical protein HN617_08340 [Planctomycetaceae bacterium]|jgi:hypothetical protein|nr:hypothetical protein [Planctomycetaceae bacterium]MBT4011959.1 hypothetical protein [Planctomycetaceae bacterium]MBT4724173.1 hypothetical protein [Planctomycetaceae bacterium]MBT4845054.1 hypothetical protein [Planctomycetaceae bacterium]MBT5123676.1 hypothetical protein [Planctomycetaceae bacterium]
MKKILLGLLITTAFALPSVETVMAREAGEPLIKQPLLFRKAKAYRREVLKQELKTELYGELGTKLDKDVAVAANEIRTALQTQVAQESKKLQNQAAGHAKKLTAGNSAFQAKLTAGNSAFQAKLTAGNNAFQAKLTADNSTFQGEMVAGANKFKEELNSSNGAFQQKLTKANQQLRKRFVAAYKSANEELAATNKAQADANAKLIDELSTATGDVLAKKIVALGNQLAADNQAAVAKEVKALVVKIDKELVLAVAKTQQSQPAPEPAPEPVPEQQNAVGAEPTVVKDDDTE